MSEERTVELKGGHLFDSLNYFSSFKFQVYTAVPSLGTHVSCDVGFLLTYAAGPSCAARGEGIAAHSKDF